MIHIITIKDLSKSFGRKRVLHNLNLDVKDGEFITIFGPNGSGKTTLIRILSTLSRSRNGQIEISGYDLSEEPENIRKQIGVISHNIYLYDELSAFENLKFFGNMYSYPEEKLKNRIVELLDEIGLQHRMNDPVGTYSRGMKQRLAIARAILHEPKILFLDEPFTGLDQNAIKMLIEILKKLHAEKCTILLTTHNIERGFKLASRIMILSGGNISFDEQKRTLDVPSFKKLYNDRVGGS